MNFKKQQIEMIYLSLLQSLRAGNIEYDEKHEILSNELLEIHECVHLLDILDEIHDFIIKE